LFRKQVKLVWPAGFLPEFFGSLIWPVSAHPFYHLGGKDAEGEMRWYLLYTFYIS